MIKTRQQRNAGAQGLEIVVEQGTQYMDARVIDSRHLLPANECILSAITPRPSHRSRGVQVAPALLAGLIFIDQPPSITVPEVNIDRRGFDVMQRSAYFRNDQVRSRNAFKRASEQS